MKQINNEIKNLINMDSDIVILDVDRTIINTTSWYQACITENLLISKENIKKFIEINDKTFLNPTKEKLEEFRINTLSLIERVIDSQYIKKVKQIIDVDIYCKEGDYTNSWRFYIAGIYTARKLVKIYDNAIKYIKYLSVYYGSNLKVIFLTAGYEPFIQGVVDEIINQTNLGKLNYSIIGSKVKFNKGNIKETFHMDQFEKQKVIESIIKMGGKIRFLADDSKENNYLFDIVRQNGGIALNIEHKCNQPSNETWNQYIDSITEESTKESLINDDSFVGLNKNHIKMPIFLDKMSKDTNEIGITSISKKIYNITLNNLIEKIKDSKNKEIFINCINNVIFEKEDIVYLRGKLYYNWLPQYIFLDDRPLNDRWKELMNISINALDIISKEKILNNSLNYYEQVIIYSFIDHLLEGMLFILNLIEQNNLSNNDLYEKEHKSVLQITQDVSDLLYSCIYQDTEIIKLVDKVLLELKQLKILKTLPQYIKTYKTMRELDNNITIFKFVKSIVDDMEKRNIVPNYIISFPYGGIDLGFATVSYMKIVLKKKKIPQILNSHFSSKQGIRENKIQRDIDFSIFKFIPNIYKNYVEEIKKGKSTILLLDNNVTTFKTLDLCKNFVKQLGNMVYAGVPSINYDNIVNNLFNKKSETLISNWRQVLDFYPIEEYITAFNTWNTSKKSKILQDIYYNIDKIHEVENLTIGIKNKNYIFKICRIQNVQDLKIAVQNGANMIGIHAVYPDRIKYLKNELKYAPLENDFEIEEDLPIGLLELNSIRDVQRIIPSNMKQAILFERALSIKNMIKTCEKYELPKEKIYIQLQHRTDKNYIEKIKENLSKNIIVTIGLFQKDFKEYFWKMNDILDPKTDYILLDLSKHQPDLITYSENYRESIDRVSILKHLAKVMENNNVPIIIADDTTVNQMEEYLKIISKYNIKIKGIDIQNTVEIETNKQRYQKIKYRGKVYQAKIRKSSTKMAEWKEFLKQIDENIFYDNKK